MIVDRFKLNDYNFSLNRKNGVVRRIRAHAQKVQEEEENERMNIVITVLLLHFK